MIINTVIVMGITLWHTYRWHVTTENLKKNTMCCNQFVMLLNIVEN